MESPGTLKICSKVDFNKTRRLRFEDHISKVPKNPKKSHKSQKSPKNPKRVLKNPKKAPKKSQKRSIRSLKNPRPIHAPIKPKPGGDKNFTKENNMFHQSVK